MQYQTGEEIIINDNVLIEHGRTKGTIKHLVDTKEALIEWGLKETDNVGVLVVAEAFDLVFWPVPDPHDPIQFVSRRIN